jgi:hypothetical protein
VKKNIIIIALLLIAGCNLNIHHTDISVIPYEYGEVIFSINKESPNQIYVIGLSHRDALTRANGIGTVKSGVQVYRIGEWLIQNKDYELLLSDGFLEDEAEDKKENFFRNDAGASINTETLEKELSREDIYINAEMLLKKSYNIRTRQVEDLKQYDAIVEKIGLLEKYSKESFEAQYIRFELDYLQEIRTATMLQKMPEVIEEEHRTGMIKNKKAIFTIGMSHIPAIVKYLKKKRIEIASPAFSAYDDYSSEVKLLKQNFGVTIIIPRTLVKLQIDG